ncbi:hypothetical protein FK516_30755, partial [Klebsiella pneumoniae]|nr:hypothetical protein [Klebsiella pneumoniae]
EQGPVSERGTHAPSPPSPTLLPPQVLHSRGYEKLVLQVGRGAVLPELPSTLPVAVDVFRFKDSLDEELRRADLVISHAGRALVVWRACF